MNEKTRRIAQSNQNSNFEELDSDDRYIVFDTETTGLDHTQEHILELAAVELKNCKLTGNQFHLYIAPRKQINPNAVEIHKLQQDFYDNYFTEVYDEEKLSLRNFLEFVGNSKLFAHNAQFDIKFINNELTYHKLPPIEENRFYCSMKLFKDIASPYKTYRCKLASCLEFLGIKSDPTNERFHNALFDTFMTARLVGKLLNMLKSQGSGGKSKKKSSSKSKEKEKEEIGNNRGRPHSHSKDKDGEIAVYEKKQSSNSKEKIKALNGFSNGYGSEHLQGNGTGHRNGHFKDKTTSNENGSENNYKRALVGFQCKNSAIEWDKYNNRKNFEVSVNNNEYRIKSQDRSCDSSAFPIIVKEEKETSWRGEGKTGENPSCKDCEWQEQDLKKRQEEDKIECEKMDELSKINDILVDLRLDIDDILKQSSPEKSTLPKQVNEASLNTKAAVSHIPFSSELSSIAMASEEMFLKNNTDGFPTKLTNKMVIEMFNSNIKPEANILPNLEEKSEIVKLAEHKEIVRAYYEEMVSKGKK